MLAEAKSFNDGWSSRLAQRALAATLDDPETTVILKRAKATYARQRHTVLSRLEHRLSGLCVRAECQDGLNVWIRLPQGYDASQVVDRAAESGVLVVSGEPFFVHPGNDSWIRISISQLTEDQAALAADRFADSLLRETPSLSLSVPV
jgi:DNA-binding transcriptional MocR family regulator